MKFIHCSDIHLDSPMESNLSPRQARERNREICHTFTELCRYAARENVRAVIVAGDLFDSSRVRARTLELVLSAIENTPEVDFLYLPGNHDGENAIFAGRELPKNLHLFGEQWTSFSYENVTITGAQITKENCVNLYESLSLEPSRQNIVTLHGQIGTQKGMDLVSLPDLRGKHIGYLALGHLHSFTLGQLDPEGQYGYSGCLEGRGFDECGPKGFVLLETGPFGLKSTFVPFAKRQLWDIAVDITGLVTLPQILKALETAGETIPKTDLVKFTLRGGCTLDTQKDLSYLEQRFLQQYYFVKIKDETHLQVSAEELYREASLKGEFIRLAMEADLSEQQRQQVIRYGLQALLGEEITG